MDFTPTPHGKFAEAFEAHIDAAQEAVRMGETPRGYLGGSVLGNECERQLAYQFHQCPVDEGRHFKGKTLRIFDMGHDAETRMAEYLRLAGFTLLTERRNGKQFGFGLVWSDERNCYLISGHIDGVVTEGPDGLGIKYPCLWENKGLGNKKWSRVKREGIMAADYVYYTQMQTYMAYLELSENPGLFTAINRDTGELYAEMVTFAPNVAQKASDKGVRIIESNSPEELPRIAKERTFYRCKWCDYQDRCWAEPEVVEANTMPAFMQSKA